MEREAFRSAPLQFAHLRAPVSAVIQQHLDDLTSLGQVRSTLVQAPNVKLQHLRRFDDRILAHFNGLAVAGDTAAKLILSALESPGLGEVFVATAQALAQRDTQLLSQCLALSDASPAARSGLVAAFNWMSASALSGIVDVLLRSETPLARLMGLRTCSLHRIDPGPWLPAALDSSDARLRSLALKASGEMGRRDLLGACRRALGDAEAECAFSAARSVLLLGAHPDANKTLQSLVSQMGPWRSDALALLVLTGTQEQIAPVLRSLADEPAHLRVLIRCVGRSGDPRYVPWLIGQMKDLVVARIAGEAFSTITGIDLALLDLERRPPEGVQYGPNDDPEDDDVTMDEDEGLPWPDPSSVQSWWAASAHRFQPGARYFMGAEPSWEHCLQVLKAGYQRQRMAAAEYLCLQRPGTVLFNCEAPAWRQQRWLEQMQ